MLLCATYVAQFPHALGTNIYKHSGPIYISKITGTKVPPTPLRLAARRAVARLEFARCEETIRSCSVVTRSRTLACRSSTIVARSCGCGSDVEGVGDKIQSSHSCIPIQLANRWRQAELVGIHEIIR